MQDKKEDDEFKTSSLISAKTLALFQEQNVITGFDPYAEDEEDEDDW